MRSTTLLRTLIAIQSLLVRGSDFDDDGLVVDVSPGWTIPRCGDCGGLARSVHDRRVRSWRHLDATGMFLKLRYSMRRVHCPACEGVKTEQVPWASPGCNFTYAFEERIAFLAQQCSKTAVSELMRVTWRTVGGIIGRVVGRCLDAEEDRLDGLNHIGIDELSYRKHHKYVTVVIDHDRGIVVWSKEGKNADTLKAFFEDLGPERCKGIESATTDMSAAYISAIKEVIPEAKLIFDRFHVQRLVQNSLDETHRDEVREASSKDDKKALKHTRWYLLKNPWNLTAAESKGLKGLEETNQALYRAYLLKESFAAILDRRQVHVARKMLTTWVEDARESGLAHFVKTAGTIERHIDGILEYVRTRFSNGRTEGVNGKIRTITRRSFGFHSATALISMIFLCCGGVHVTPAFSRPSGFH